LIGAGRWPRRLALLAWVVAVLLVHQWGVQQFKSWQPLAASAPPRLAVNLVQRASVRTVAPPKAQPPAAAKPVPAAGGSASVPPPEPAASVAPVSLPESPASAAATVIAKVADAASAAPSAALPSAAASAPAWAASSPRPGDAPGPEWPLSTQLRYSLVGNYNGPVHGDAEVEWLRQGARYQVRLRVAVGPKYAPFLQRRLSSDGVLTASGIQPKRYDETTQLLWRTSHSATVLLAGQQVRLGQGQTVPAPPGTQDSASQFVHLTWLLLTGREPATAGHVITLPVALPQQLSPWRYEVVGDEVVTTPLGRLPAVHLRPLPPHPPGALVAEVWLAPGFQYLPAQIRIAQDNGVWVLLTLAEAPLQEAPPENQRTP
jgi:hypothetical protein